MSDETRKLPSWVVLVIWVEGWLGSGRGQDTKFDRVANP